MKRTRRNEDNPVSCQEERPCDMGTCNKAEEPDLIDETVRDYRVREEKWSKISKKNNINPVFERIMFDDEL